MSIDQAILESTAVSGQTTLRFYRWTPATLSLGYFQKVKNRDSHSPSIDCPIVRRASGGGAIVHDDELTYSLCVATAGTIAKASVDLYDIVHHAIRKSLAEQGIAVSLYEATADETVKASKDDPFLCFQRRAVGDLICDGAKVGGSAQRRLKNTLIQHGSLLLSKSEFAPELRGLKESSGIEVDFQSLIEGIRQQLEEALSVTFILDETSDSEKLRAEEIAEERFSRPRWTAKK